MRTDELRSLGQSVYDAINARDTATLGRLFAPDVVRHATGEVGIAKATQAMARAFAAFPDTRFEVEDLVADAELDRVALRVTVHRGPPPAAGTAPIIMEIFRVEDGRVAEIWGAGTAPPP